jgi:hypothetical protein
MDYMTLSLDGEDQTMKRVDNNVDDEKYSEYVTTHDQIIDAADLLTSKIEYHRKRSQRLLCSIGMAVSLKMLCFALLFAVILIAEESLGSTLSNVSYAQSSLNITSPLNKTQEWKSEKDGMKILFTYQPERPIIDTFTKLEFSAINLTNNEGLKDFDARVVVTNGQRLFKFENITVPNRDFSVEYIFPDDGTHQVLTRIDKGMSVRVLASFDVFVPHQAPPSLLNPFPNASANEIESITRILVVLISFSVIIAVVIILRKGKRKNRKKGDWGITNKLS